jgi:LPXTG-motif cell wall-anchored protein
MIKTEGDQLSGRTWLRPIATCVATLTVGLAFVGVPAAADPPDTPTTPPTETSAPIETSTPATDPPGNEPAPKADQPAAKAAEVSFEVTAEFDKPSYRSGDLITVTVHIKNTGTDKVEGLRAGPRFSAPGALVHDSNQWGDLVKQAGVTIEAGATHTVTLSGHQQTADAESVTLAGDLFNERGLGFQSFSFSAPIVKRVGTVAGIVFGDKNNNGVFDQGEGLPNVEVTLSDGRGSQFKATSDAGGHFDFGKIPTVTYFSGAIHNDGWVIPFDQVIVDESDRNSDLRLRGERPLPAGTLAATMKFTKSSYQPGDVAHVTVTLTNSGTLTLFGIVASCNRGGFDSSLDGTGPGWGDLALFAKGVTITPGQTLTLDVSEKVRKAAQDVGQVSVGCDFGYREEDIDNHAKAGDQAAAPGGIATLVGDVLSAPSVGVPGVKVTLVNPKLDCPVVAETTTDAKGHFEFKNLAPGPDHVVYFIPPAGFKIKFDNPTPADVRVGSGGRMVIQVEPGDGPLPTVPKCATPTTTPTTTTTPAPASQPQGRSSSGLASTGASVVGLSALGALALLAGAGALVHTRRRRKATS